MFESFTGLLRRLWRGRGVVYHRASGGTIAPEGRLELMHFRHVEASDTMSIGTAESAQAMKSENDRLIGVRVADSQRTSSGADLSLDRSTVSYHLQGVSRQNEQGVHRVATLLVERLNLDGASWQSPVLKDSAALEEGVDAESRDDARILRIQVTRAERRGEVWSRLRAEGAVAGSLSVEEAVAALRFAIELKSFKTPVAQRRELVLALDALDTSAFAMDPVVERFRVQFGAWVRALEYESIWVIGPNLRLTARLDAATGIDDSA